MAAPVESARSVRWRELDAECRTSGTWTAHESPHYFAAVQHGRKRAADPEFAEEVLRRAESQRAAVRELFPHPEGDPNPVRRAPSVLRVLASRNDYHSYGGPGGATSYWDPTRRETVLYDSDAIDRRRTTWRALNSMVFYEYVDSNFGELAAPWFELGHAEYFTEFEFSRDKHTTAEVPEFRVEKEDDTPPPSVREFVERFSGSDPRGRFELYNTGGLPVSHSLVHLLRRGPIEGVPWNESWRGRLDKWWSVWLEHRDAARANAAAFEGVDWDELDHACKALCERSKGDEERDSKK